MHPLLPFVVAALVGGVGGALAAPGLQRLTREPERRRWFLTRPATAVVGGVGGLVVALVADALTWWLAPALAVLLGAAAGAVLVDAAVHRLPDVLVLRGWALGALLCLAGVPDLGLARIAVALGLSAAVWGVLTALVLALPRAMGYGDVKLLGLLALATGLVGPGAVLGTVVAAYLLGGLAALAMMATRRLRRDEAMAFGPWLGAGALVSLCGAVLPSL